MFPLFGAFYYWFPKWTGRLLSERAGHFNFWLLFVGFTLVFFPMHILGLNGMPRRVYTYLPETGWGDLNLLATVGAFTMGLGVLVFLGNVVWARKFGMISGDNSWGADTLEWSISSPPPSYSFQHIPVVQGRYALWNRTADAPIVTGLRTDIREVLSTTLHDAAPDHRYEIPGPSIYPFLLAPVTGGVFIGSIFTPWVVPAAVLAFIILFAWFWSNSESKRASPEAVHQQPKEKIPPVN